MNNWILVGLGMILLLGSIGSSGAAIAELPTSQAGIVGYFERGPIDLPLRVDAGDFGFWFGSGSPAAWPAEIQARAFFQQGGSELVIVRVAPGAPLIGAPGKHSGMRALDVIADLRLLIMPELTSLTATDLEGAASAVRAYVDERHLFAILDPPPGLLSAGAAVAWANGSLPDDADGFAIYYPYLELGIDGSSITAGASGTMAAIYAANDASSGIWDAPAGTDLPLAATGLSLQLTSTDSGLLNTNHINPIREFAGIGIVPWGSRTMDHSSAEGERRYLSTSRLKRWMEASITSGLAFAAIADNDSSLWDLLRGEVEDFLANLWRDGALAGVKPDDAFFVRCDRSTTTNADIAASRVVVLYGFAPLRPAEFALTPLRLPTFDPARPIPDPPLEEGIAGNDLFIAYPTAPGFSYQLQSSPTLSFSGGGAWVGGNGAWRRERFTINSRSMFYRVLVKSDR